MKMRADYEFTSAVAALTGMSREEARALALKIDTEAPKHLITDHEITRYVGAVARKSKRYTAEERDVAPAVAFLKKVLAMKVENVVDVKVEDMSKLKVPQRVRLERIQGSYYLGPNGERHPTNLHSFAKGLAKQSKTMLSLGELLKAQRDDHRGFDSYLQCNTILEKYFIGQSIDEGDVRKSQYQGKHMEIFSNVDRSFDTYEGGRVDVNLRPHIEVQGSPGDIVIMYSSLRHSEPEVVRLTPQRSSAKFPWWGDSNIPSTMTIVVARPAADDVPTVIDSVKLRIPVNVAHVKAAKPHQVRSADC